MAARKNPIQQRLELVHDEWVVFAEQPEARIACWLVTPDEVPMVDAFVAMESDERSATLPELFVKLTSPFDNATPYGFALCGEFLKLAEAMHEGLESPDSAPWKPPQWQAGQDDVALWIRSATGFHAHYALPGQFVAWLAPESVADPGAFQLWLQRFAGQAPANVRLLVLDERAAPSLAALARTDPRRVVQAPLDLDMPGARLEISQQAGGLDTPGGQFRQLWVKLGNALGEAKLPEAMAFGDAALVITAAQRWFGLAVPIHFALGAALAGAGRTTEANERYLAAELAATEGEKAGDVTCKQLRAQSRMVRGGLLVSVRQYPAAANLFMDTLPLATAVKDPRMVLDCYRLASFSFEQSGQYEKAWQQGVDGLAYAHQLDAETRQTSTLSYLGEGLMRLTQRSEYSASNLRIEREMVSLLGRTDWRPATAAPAPNASPGASPA